MYSEYRGLSHATPTRRKTPRPQKNWKSRSQLRSINTQGVSHDEDPRTFQERSPRFDPGSHSARGPDCRHIDLRSRDGLRGHQAQRACALPASTHAFPTFDAGSAAKCSCRPPGGSRRSPNDSRLPRCAPESTHSSRWNAPRRYSSGRHASRNDGSGWCTPEPADASRGHAWTDCRDCRAACGYTGSAPASGNFDDW